MQEPVVFERRLGRGRAAALLIGLGAASGLPLVSDHGARAAADLAAAAGMATPAAAASVVDALLELAPAAGLVLGVGWASRRFARATVGRDHVLIEPLGLTTGAIIIPLEDVVGRKDTPFGVLLDAPASFSRSASRLFPALIPADTAGELARIHALLDAPAVEPPAPVPTATAGRKHTPLEGTLVAAVLGVAVASAVGLHLVAGLPSFVGGALLATATLVAVVSLVPRRLRVHLGVDVLTLGTLRLPWSEVGHVWACGPRLIVESHDGRRGLARPGTEAVSRLAEVARARLGDARVIAGEPAWSRRRRRLRRAAVGALVVPGLWLGPARALTLEGCVGVDGHHGQRARIVYRGLDQAPRLVVIVDPPHVPLRVRAGGWRSLAFDEPGADRERRIDVDLRAGRVLALGEEHAVPQDATVVHVSRSGVRWSRAPLLPRPMGALTPPPSDVTPLNVTLHEFLVWTGGEVALVGDVVEGRTSTRCFDATSRRLLLQARDGVLTSMVLFDPGANLTRWQQTGGCPACMLAAEQPRRLVRLTASGELFHAELPGLEVALDAYRDVCDGRPVEQATAAFAADLWSRPVTGGR